MDLIIVEISQHLPGTYSTDSFEKDTCRAPCIWFWACSVAGIHALFQSAGRPRSDPVRSASVRADCFPLTPSRRLQVSLFLTDVLEVSQTSNVKVAEVGGMSSAGNARQLVLCRVNGVQYPEWPYSCLRKLQQGQTLLRAAENVCFLREHFSITMLKESFTFFFFIKRTSRTNSADQSVAREN